MAKVTGLKHKSASRVNSPGEKAKLKKCKIMEIHVSIGELDINRITTKIYFTTDAKSNKEP